MAVLVAFSVVPGGTGNADGSVHDAVAAAVQIVRDSGSAEPHHLDVHRDRGGVG